MGVRLSGPVREGVARTLVNRDFTLFGVDGGELGRHPSRARAARPAGKADGMNGPGEILPRAAARDGDGVALVTATRTLTFGELDQASDRVAAALAARGIRPGEPVSLYAQNRWEWVVAYHAVLKAGAVVNPINVMLTPEEVAYVLNDCKAGAVFAAADQAAAVLRLADSVPTLRTVIALDGEVEGAEPFAALLGRWGRSP